MRLGRRNDLSAADLSHLDLTQTVMHHVCFSREDGEHRTDFTGAAVFLSCFLPQDRIYSIHPWKRFWVCADNEGISCRLPGNHRKISYIRCSRTPIAVQDCGDYAMVYALDYKRENNLQRYYSFRLDSNGMLTYACIRDIELSIQMKNGEKALFVCDEEGELYWTKQPNGYSREIDEIIMNITFDAIDFCCVHNKVYIYDGLDLYVDIESGQVLCNPDHEYRYKDVMVIHPFKNTPSLQDEELASVQDTVFALDETAQRMACFSRLSMDNQEYELQIWSVHQGKRYECLYRSKPKISDLRKFVWHGDMVIAICRNDCCLLTLQGDIISKTGPETYKWIRHLSEKESEKMHVHIFEKGDPVIQLMIKDREEPIQNYKDALFSYLHERIADPSRKFEFKLSSDEPDRFMILKHCAKENDWPDCQLTLDEMDEVFKDDPQNKPVFLSIKGCSMRDIHLLNSLPEKRKNILRMLAYCGAVID